MTDEKITTEAEAIAALAAQPVVLQPGGVPYLVLPEGWTVKEVEADLAVPLRKRGTVRVKEVDSFIDVCKRYGSLADCNIYLNVDYAKQQIVATAIFNDHADGDGEPGWRDHRAIFEPAFSEEWRRWTRANKMEMEQAKLANFFEDNLADIVPVDKLPSGSDVLTFVTRLEETRKVKYGSAVNLQNGMVQIEFVEESGDGATKGRLEVFREFAIGIRPFFNGDGYEIRALLRYRINRNSGDIFFWYELKRPDRVLEEASKGLIETIRTKTGMPIIFGEP